jgi:4-hydroxy-2-oxoheptanedioate aldolase
VNPLREKWRAGEPTWGAWLALPNSWVAESISRLGFDYVCIDLQHGMIDYPDATELVLAIHAGGSVPVVRVPSNDLAAINRMLDAGARGIIVPLVETLADVESAAAACRYPPAGRRSYGPNRAALHSPGPYFETANDDVLCIPMIETRAALEGVEKLAAVPGVDALYVGPNDLSLALGLPPGPDSPDPYQSAYRRIARACREAGIAAGIHANAALAAKHRESDYRMITVSTDASALVRGVAADLEKARASGAATR